MLDEAEKMYQQALQAGFATVSTVAVDAEEEEAACGAQLAKVRLREAGELADA
jgi:hypothetical protein